MSQVDKQPDWLYLLCRCFGRQMHQMCLLMVRRLPILGGERAAEPTVKYNGTRSVASNYNRPKLEDLVPLR